MKYLISFIVIVFFTGCIGHKTIPGTDTGRINFGHIPYKNEMIFLEVEKEWKNTFNKNTILSSDKKYLFTVSNEKEIDVFDIENRKLIKRIRAEKKSNDMGKILSLGLTNDNKYLASSGIFEDTSKYFSNPDKVSEEELLNMGTIRLYDASNYKLLRLLKSHKGQVSKLLFTKDSKYLVSISTKKRKLGKQEMILWDMDDFSVKNRVNISYQITDAKLINKNKKVILITASTDKKIRSYDLKDFKLLEKEKGRKSFRVLALGKNEFAVSYGKDENRVYILNYNLSYKTEINTNSNPIDIKYSDDSKFLLVSNTNGAIEVFNRETNSLESRFVEHKRNSLGFFLSSKKILSIGGQSNEILIWDMYSHKFEKIISSDKGIQSLGTKGSMIAIGDSLYANNKRKINNRGPLSKSFDLEKKVFKKDVLNFNTIPMQDKLSKVQLIASSKNAPKYIVRLYKGEELNKVPFENGQNYWAFGLYNYSPVGVGKNGKVETLGGGIKYLGAKSFMRTLAIYDKFLIASGDLGVIYFWLQTKEDFSRVRRFHPKLSLYIKDNEWVLWTSDGYFDSSENGYKHIGFHLNQGHDKEAKWIGIEKLYDHFYRPDLVKLALKGYDISKFTNNLSYKEVLKNPPPHVKIVKANKKVLKDRNLNHYKRDINIEFNVSQIDNGGVGLIRIYQEGKLVKTIGKGLINKTSANAYKQLENQQLNEKAKKQQEHYLKKLEKVASKSITGTVKTEELIKNVKPLEIKNNEGSYTVTLPLKAGENSISIEAFNKTNTVVSLKENLIVNAKIKKIKPTVYAIVAGVNEFENSKQYSNLKYSQNDAKAIKKALETKIKEKVVVKYLIGKDLTKKNLQKAIEDIKSKAKLEDKVIFYISTHGKAIKGDLYLLPQNNKKAKNWIKFEDVFKKIQSINALEQVFVIDACESGKANDIVSSIYDSKASVLAKSSGVHVLLATTKGTYAFEHPNPNIKHGVFTNNILKALNDKSIDKNRDRKISVIELSKALKEPKYVVEHQYPVIRNVGYDTKVRDLK